MTDLLAVSVAPGIFFGRIANFINGELWGRICVKNETFLCFTFPASGDLQLRYASQLYEAFFEGLVLFVLISIIALIVAKNRANHNKTMLCLTQNGVLSCLFIILYGIFRFFIEYVREPDVQIGLLFNIISMGQLLCLGMILLGSFVLCFVFIKARQK